MDKWECRDLGDVKEFLRMRITRNGYDIHLDQIDYLKKVLERFKMANANSHPTPAPKMLGVEEGGHQCCPGMVVRTVEE